MRRVRQHPTSRRRRLIRAAAFLAAVALAGGAPEAAAQGAPPVRRQLVVPFENAAREAQSYWLTEGSAVILTDALAALGAPVIPRDDRLRAFDRLRVPAVASLSHATVIRLGQLVGAGEIIVGSFQIIKGTPAADGTARQDLVARVRVIRLDTGRLSPEILESGPLAELVDIYGRVARRLVPDSPVTPEEVEQGRPPIAALEQYVKGLVAQTPSSKTTFLTQALRLHPALVRARIELWRVHTEEGDHRDALAAVEPVSPDHRLARQARFLAGVSMLHLGQYAQAFSVFSELNRRMPDPALLNNLGVVQLRRTDGVARGGAGAYFTEASRLDATDSDVFFNLGYTFWLEKDVPAAIHWLREAVRRNPADDGAHYLLGVALQANGNTVEAAREKELARRLSSEYAEWEARQGATANTIPPGLERIKTDVDVPAALRVENVIVAAEQRDQRELAGFHLAAGRRAYDAERDVEAIAELRRAIYLSPYDAAAHLLLGRAYLRSGRIDEAIDALKIAIWSEDTIAARLVLAEAYIQARDIETARAELGWILEADPQNRTATQLLQRLPPK